MVVEDLKKMKRIVNLINFIPLVFLLFFLFSVLFFEKASRFSDKELNGWLNENIKYKDLYDFSSFYTLSYDALRVEIENRLKIYKDKTFKYPPKNSVYNFFEKLFTKLHLI